MTLRDVAYTQLQLHVVASLTEVYSLGLQCVSKREEWLNYGPIEKTSLVQSSQLLLDVSDRKIPTEVNY